MYYNALKTSLSVNASTFALQSMFPTHHLLSDKTASGKGKGKGDPIQAMKAQG
jgi:hypothetical protein